MKSVCVYCGSRDGDDPAFAVAAEAIGAGLAALNLRLVYGAGDVGLMGRVASAAMGAGGEVLGVIPKHLMDREVGKRDISELIVVDTMHQRKMIMAENSDAFIALPGGPGTLDELFEILTWRQLKLHQKPAHLLNIAGYWDPLVTLMNGFAERGFADKSFLEFLDVHANVDSLLSSLKSASG